MDLLAEFAFGVESWDVLLGIDGFHIEAEFLGDVAVGSTDLLSIAAGDFADLPERRLDGLFPERVIKHRHGDTLDGAAVGLSVGVIVSKGPFRRDVDRLRTAPAGTRRLFTVGVAISLIGTTLVGQYGPDLSLGSAFLVDALLVETGPTVITPIMDIVAVRERVAATLETERVVNDVTAAFLAIVVFEYVTLETHSPVTIVSQITHGLGDLLVVVASIVRTELVPM